MGAGMQALIVLGKGLVGVFWLVFGAALAKWLGSPFQQMVYLLAAALLVIHGLEMWLFAGLLRGRPSPWLDRFQILLFGAFHLLTLKSAPAGEARAQVAVEEVAHA